MKLLAVDSAEKGCSLALMEDGAPLAEFFFHSRATHAESLMEGIEILFARAGLSPGEVDGFVVSRGPGSFTGLRIGISAVKGMAFALSKPVAGVSSLDGLAFQAAFFPGLVFPMMDARRGEVYCARYRFCDGRLREKGRETAVTPMEALGQLETLGENVLFMGSGALVHGEVIKRRLGKTACFCPGFQSRISAPALARRVFDDPSILSSDPSALVPVYLRRSDAEINYERHPHRFN
ncbi:MAG: tRNA (adenosine(37)-N6)-threonylcarbamoyltransferase complex dimerization subunit type 1 TsaB [Desulfobacteraceae bacterium 4572_89]|nr:MAG: tRNA (adenosine(37)-N6)-threonylcarbamoyltransferase complex dimerization subunit type 1 TsaB [Desulfobacteraceae bacterium 4572_89]